MLRFLIVLNIAVSLLNLLMPAALEAVNPPEESLIAAWEKAQKDNPRNILIEKLEQGRYRFETKFFPFNGELRIVNTFIDSTQNPKYPYKGEIEVELVGVSETFMERYRSGYSRWERMNYFHYQAEDTKWLTISEFQQLASSSEPSQPSPSLLEYLQMYLPTIVLLILFLWFGYYLHVITLHLDNNNHQWKRCIELLNKIENIQQLDHINRLPSTKDVEKK